MCECEFAHVCRRFHNCVCVFLQPALQLFPVSYHTALKVAELYVCVCECVSVSVSAFLLPAVGFFFPLKGACAVNETRTRVPRCCGNSSEERQQWDASDGCRLVRVCVWAFLCCTSIWMCTEIKTQLWVNLVTSGVTGQRTSLHTAFINWNIWTVMNKISAALLQVPQHLIFLNHLHVLEHSCTCPWSCPHTFVLPTAFVFTLLPFQGHSVFPEAALLSF